MRPISLATAKAVIGGWLFLVAGCAHFPPGQPVPPSQQYLQAFGACMESAGISAAPGIGMQVWQILESGGTQASMIQAFESLGIAQAGVAIQAAAMCAVTAWASTHPVAGTVSPAQAAVRVLMARYGARPTMRR